MNLAALLFELPAGTAPGDPVIYAGYEVITREQLSNRAGALRGALKGMGVTDGTPVAVMLGDDASAIAALFAVWAAGGVHVPLSPRRSDEENGRIVDAMAPIAAVTSAENMTLFTFRGIPTLVIDGDAYRVERSAVAPPATAHSDADAALLEVVPGTDSRTAVVHTHADVLAGIDEELADLRRTSSPEELASPQAVAESLSTWEGIYDVCLAFRAGAPVTLEGSA